MRPYLRALPPLAAVALALACGEGPLSSSPEDRAAPQDRGTPLTGGVANHSGLAWSADGAEVLHVAAGPDGTRLRARRIASDESRSLDGPRDQHAGFALSPDRGALYFVAHTWGAERPAGYRIALDGAGGAERIADRTVGWLSGGAGGAALLPAPDGARVAYIAAPDTLALYDPATRERRVVAAGCLGIAAFSPDGGRVLCRIEAQGERRYRVLALPNGEPIDELSGTEPGWVQSVRWDGTGIAGVYWTGTRLLLQRAGEQPRALWSYSSADPYESPDLQHYAWSPDGSRLAFWTARCIRDLSWKTCGLAQRVLHAADVRSGRVDTVAVAHGGGAGGAVAFSPDGARLAYVFDGFLYFKPVP